MNLNINTIDKSYYDYINHLDKQIIKLFSIRQKYKTNIQNFRMPILGGNISDNNNISYIDNLIYKYESNNIDLNKSHIKLFNPLLKKKKSKHNNSILDFEELNLNNIIKQVYISSLYDLSDYGKDEINLNNNIVNIDIELLFKISERIHFGYEIIKQMYLKNKVYFEKHIFIQKNNPNIISHIYDYSEQPTYFENLDKVSKFYNVNNTFICSFYKLYIIPFYLETQLYFINKLIDF